MLNQPAVSSDIRAAEMKSQGKAEPDRYSAGIPLDGDRAGAVRSGPLQLGFDLNLEGSCGSEADTAQSADAPDKGKDSTTPANAPAQGANECVVEDDGSPELPGPDAVGHEKSELTDPLVSIWLETLAGIAADIARREVLKRKD